MINVEELAKQRGEVSYQMNLVRDKISAALRERDVTTALLNAQGTVIHAANVAIEAYNRQMRHVDSSLSELHNQLADLSRQMDALTPNPESEEEKKDATD